MNFQQLEYVLAVHKAQQFWQAAEDCNVTQATLSAMVRKLEDEVEELREASETEGGNSARDFVGEGNRQYLTGLNLGGNHILIMLDTSASMLAQKLVNVIRLRNMKPEIQRRADKWTRVVNTVDWLTAQLPVQADYQVITFNADATPALAGTEGSWLQVSDKEQLIEVTNAVREIVPGGGTSFENAFAAVQQLSPAPDNIFLITDGLPTQGAKAPNRTKVSGQERQKLYRQSVRLLPRNVPINIILAPMEGDPMAASEFWQLAQNTGGSFMSPAQDWP